MRRCAPILALVALLGPGWLHAQQGVTTFGLQVKPVIPFGFFENKGALQQEHLSATLDLNGGMAFGMLVRHGITKAISLEVGIDQINRRYDFTMANDTNGYSGSGRLRYVGYEVPVVCLVYVRLGENTWMNNALGASVDFYPSDAHRELDYAQAYLFRRNWAQVGVLGNIGVEYRTEKSGYFYLGATYHRPFGDMAQADATWLDRYAGYKPYRMITRLSGSYLTVDLRYFFHEDPDKARLRKARNR
ncbi:MAG TPA: hypothetical protein PKD45_00045 [Flavobacteriales bacterium]|nr:hypothetical protein [Flavobacteriales bacterium]